MKQLKILSVVLSAALVAVMLAACGGTGGGPVTLTDMMGREVTLNKPAEKVVGLSAADCEILYALGAGDKVVGRGEYCDWPAEVLEKPAVESGMETNVEQIIALQPDLVLMASMAQKEEVVTQLEAAGIPCAVSEAYDIAGVYTSIEMVGKAVGKTAEAEKLVAEMKQGFEDLRARVPAGEGKRIYFEVSPLEYGLWAAGAGSFMDEIGTMLGLENIFGDQSAWAGVSQEQVIDLDPEVIVTISMYFGEGPTPTEEIAARPGWEDIAAVKDGALLNVANNELSRPGPRLVDGARQLVDFIYGDAAA